MRKNSNMHGIEKRRRSGATLSELVVACVLLVSTSGLLVKSIAGANRVEKSMQHYAIATDELANQIERLSLLRPEEVGRALERLTLSDEAARMLPSAELTSEFVADENGRRVTLRLNWDRVGDSIPLLLTTWLPTVTREVESE